MSESTRDGDEAVVTPSSALVAATSAPALANQKWTGISVGVGIGAGAVVHDVTIGPGALVPPGTFDFGFDGIGGEGIFGTVSVGADYQLPNGFVVGAFFDYDFSDIESTLNLSIPGFGLDSARGDVKLDSVWSIGGRVGYLTSPQTLVYGLLAYSEADFSNPQIALTGGGVPGGTLTLAGTVPTFKCITVGGGIETQLGAGFSLKGEYRYTEFDKERLTTGLEDFAITNVEPSLHTARVSLNYKFHRESAPAAPLK
jgi:outer membrane immunogenic protein